MASKKYPWQNLSLGDLKGEEWKDVPGFEGYCQISSFGRMKRLEYAVQYPAGHFITKPEKILKAQVKKHKNYFVGDFSHSVAYAISISGTKHHFLLNRLLYYCFIEEFDMDDPDILILRKNGDWLDYSLSNLIKATRSEKQQKIYDRKRFVSPFKSLSEETKQEAIAASVEKVRKPVIQYLITGKKIAAFPSITEASAATGILVGSIINTVKARQATAGGYYWSTVYRKSADIKAFLQAFSQKRKSSYREKQGQKVTQYDMEGNKIAQYPSLADAETATGTNAMSISGVLRRVNKSANGFFWKKGYGKDKIDLSEHHWGLEQLYQKNRKPVSQFTLEGKFIKSYPSVKAAADATKVRAIYIGAVCRGVHKHTHGFIWKFS